MQLRSRSILFLSLLGLSFAACESGDESPDSAPRTIDEQAPSAKRSSDRWAALGPSARAALDRLSERNADPLVVEVRPDRRVGYLFGEALSSGACAERARGLASSDRRRSLALCFLAEAEPAIAGEDSQSLLSSLHVTGVDPGPDGAEGAGVVHVVQRHESVVVKHADARVFLRDGKVDAFAGNLRDPRKFPKRAPAARDLAQIAEGLAGHELSRDEAYFDADLGRFVVRFHSEDRGLDRFDYLLDEATGELLSREDAALHSPKPIRSLDFPNGWSGTGPTAKTVEMTLTPQTSTLYHHSLQNPAEGAPTNTYYSVGTFFPDGSCNNEPRQLADLLASPSATPWSTVTGGMYEAGNAYYWMNQLNAMRTHWSGSFGYPQRQVDLDVIVGPCLPSGAGEYYPTSGAGGDLYLGSSSAGVHTWSDLATMAHEYGHHVHDRYYMRGTRALQEGFAETFVARWLRYANEFRGEWPSLGYNEPSMEFQQHTAVLVNGEYALGGVSGKSHLYYPATPQCTPNEDWGGPGSEPYACGGVVPNVFWELLWDTCQLGYGACDQGQDIIQTGVYASQARRLANNAYTWAIYNMSSGGTVGEFFNHVSYYYQDKKNAGTISVADYNRVLSVLAHHCLGYNNTCQTSHKLPDSHLPSSQTRKGPLYFEAESGTRAGSSVISDAAGSSAGAFVWVASPGNAVTFTATIPAGAGGNYKVKVVGRHYNAPSSTLRVTPTGFAANTIAIPASAWAWHATSTNYAFTAGQTVTVRLENVTGSIDLDAIVLEKQ